MTQARSSFPIGGFADWWPHRDASSLHEYELNYARQIDLGDLYKDAGVAIAGTLLEPFSSSTRNEIGGLIVACTSPKPLHYATDSEALVKRFDALRDGVPTRRPLGQLPDGDLWSIVQRALTTRGHHATRVSWTKGHTSIDAIRQGSVTIKAAMGNALADKAAGMADQATDSEHKTALLNYFAHKQQAYTKLIAAISRRIIRVTEHTRSCRQALAEEHAKTEDGRFVLTPELPRFACIADSRTLKLVDDPPICGGSQQQHSMRLRIFWTTIYVCPISDPNMEHGITWLQ